MGSGFVNQCPGCHRLKTLKPAANEDVTQVIMKCSSCKSTTRYNFPEGWKWVSGPPVKGDERGAWIVCNDQEGNDSDTMDTT
jgi:NADH:ubiquinone oxidoreductase subunit F (NADH-binding)